jgi:hypothetical protein
MKRLLTILSQKWPEYLIEAIVIIASILGAYSLDRWNEDRKTKLEKIELVKLLIVDYEGNLLQLNQKIKLHEAVISSGFAVLDDFDQPTKANLDSLLENLLIVGMDPTFDPSTNNLLEGGRISYIQNPELIGLISNWGADIAALRELELMV